MPAIMGLSLIQPWATLVVCGAKKFETRGMKLNEYQQLSVY